MYVWVRDLCDREHENEDREVLVDDGDGHTDLVPCPRCGYAIWRPDANQDS